MKQLTVTAAAMLASVARTLNERGIALYMSDVKGAAADVMQGEDAEEAQPATTGKAEQAAPAFDEFKI